MSRLVPQPADALLGLIALFKADPRPNKIDWASTFSARPPAPRLAAALSELRSWH